MPPKKDDSKAKFIEAVREFPFLYDLKDEDYKNKTKVDEKWTRVSKNFQNDTGTDTGVGVAGVDTNVAPLSVSWEL